VEAILKRLKTDYIALYWVHIWDQITPVEEELSGERWPEGIHAADIAAASRLSYVTRRASRQWQAKVATT
jgi:aryl-alcohol dehydrogenase-like predicted oxidoreductase